MNHLEIITPKLPYTLTTEVESGLRPEVIDAIAKIYPDVLAGKNGTIPKLKKLIGKYPGVKQFRNYLAQAYLSTGNVEQAKMVNERLLMDFPDYLFAKMFLADIFLNEGTPERYLDLLGPNLHLQELYPERTEFHIAEFMTYQNMAVKYFLSVDNIQEAENRLMLMEEQDEDHSAVKSASFMIGSYNLKNAANRWDEGEKYRRRPVVIGYNKELQTDEAPVFNHPEIEALYQNTLRIDPALVKSILELPRESLLEDLHLVLEDAVNRYEYFRDGEQEPKEDQFVLHAMFLLADLGSGTSLPHLLNFLRQGDELLDFWLSDFLTEDMWEIVYHCGHSQLAALRDFVQEPNNYMYGRSAVSTTIQQVALHQPERRAEVLELYRLILEFMLAKAGDEDVNDAQLNAFLIGDIIPLGAEKLTETITALYEADVVDPDIVGRMEVVLRDIPVRRGRKYEKRVLFTDALSRYDDVLKTWPWYKHGEDLNPALPAVEASEHNHRFDEFNQMPFVAAPKIGRNDPCPCGSGKKYKKCCMG